MDSTKQQNTEAPSNESIIDPWATTIVDRQDLYSTFQPFEDGHGGSSLDKNVYNSVEPSDTPESSRSGLSEQSSELYEGVQLDINLDKFDDVDIWEPEPFDDLLWSDEVENFLLTGNGYFDKLFSYDGDGLPNVQQYATQLPPASISDHQQLNMKLHPDPPKGYDGIYSRTEISG